MTIKIIGAGFGRTGTKSLQAAILELGFGKCYHMTEVIKRPAHGQMWHAAWRGQAIDWDALFNGYQATVDWPGAAFYKELMVKYPDAKVLLTVRDPEKWYASAFDTIFKVRTVIPHSLGKVIPPMRHMPKMIESIIWQGIFDGRFADKNHAIEVFERHNAAVIAAVPPEKLLVFNVKDGWKPLCRFLEVPIPDRPFPHLNDRQMFGRLIWVRNLLPIIFAFLGLAVVWILSQLFKRLGSVAS
jgi:hypothetical protein